MKTLLLSIAILAHLFSGENAYVSSDLGISITPPKWSADSGLGQNVIFFLKGDGKFSPNINIQSQNLKFADFVSVTDNQFVEYGMKVIKRELKQNEVWYEYSGTMQNIKLHWCLRAWKDGERTIVITGTAAENQWEATKDEIKRSIDSATVIK